MSRRVQKISMDLTPASIDNAIRELREWKDWIEEKTKLLTRELASVGVQIANMRYAQAVYDGDNDVTVTFYQRGENDFAVIAAGRTVFFIEFGTGVRYNAPHPEANRMGMIRGQYGRGQGSNPKGWYYIGEAGTSGRYVGERKSGPLYHTYGNPANQSLWKTRSELIDRFETIARRVFV